MLHGIQYGIALRDFNLGPRERRRQFAFIGLYYRYGKIYFAVELVGGWAVLTSFYPFLLKNAACSCKWHWCLMGNRMLRWLSPLCFAFLVLIPTQQGTDSMSFVQRLGHDSCAALSFGCFLAAEHHTLGCAHGNMLPTERRARRFTQRLSAFSFSVFGVAQILYAGMGIRSSLLSMLSFAGEMYGCLCVFVSLATIWYFSRPKRGGARSANWSSRATPAAERESECFPALHDCGSAASSSGSLGAEDGVWACDPAYACEAGTQLAPSVRRYESWYLRAKKALLVTALALVVSHFVILVCWWDPRKALMNCANVETESALGCAECRPGTRHDRWDSGGAGPSETRLCDELSSNELFWTTKLGAACVRPPAEAARSSSSSVRLTSSESTSSMTMHSFCVPPATPYSIDVSTVNWTLFSSDFLSAPGNASSEAGAILRGDLFSTVSSVEQHLQFRSPFQLITLAGCEIQDVRRLADPELRYLRDPGNPITDFAVKGVACARLSPRVPDDELYCTTDGGEAVSIWDAPESVRKLLQRACQ